MGAPIPILYMLYNTGVMDEPHRIKTADLRRSLAEVIRDVDRGETYIVEHYDRAVARIVPLEATMTPAIVKAVHAIRDNTGYWATPAADAVHAVGTALAEGVDAVELARLADTDLEQVIPLIADPIMRLRALAVRDCQVIACYYPEPVTVSRVLMHAATLAVLGGDPETLADAAGVTIEALTTEVAARLTLTPEQRETLAAMHEALTTATYQHERLAWPLELGHRESHIWFRGLTRIILHISSPTDWIIMIPGSEGRDKSIAAPTPDMTRGILRELGFSPAA